MLISVALTAWSQDHAFATAKAKSSSPWLPFDKGFVEGRTYKNTSLGLEFTPSPELTLGIPELRGTPGTLPLMVAIGAWGEKKWLSAREGTVFFADTLAYYAKDQRSTDAYMRRVAVANQRDGFERVQGGLENKLSGISFARTDFHKKVAYEVVFVKACEGQALVFVFTGPTEDIVDKFIAGTELKLDLSRSGCRANN